MVDNCKSRFARRTKSVRITAIMAAIAFSAASFLFYSGAVSMAAPLSFLTFSSGDAFATLGGGPAETVVTESDQQAFVATETAGGDVDFVFDNNAPSGNGALRLTTDGTAGSKASYLRAADPNTLLSSVTELSYYTKQISGGPAADPAYQIPVYLCGGTEGFTTLNFEPYQKNGAGPNPPIVPGVWEFQDVDQGMFSSSRSVTCDANSVVAGAGGAPFYSLATLQANFPNAVVLGYGVNVGSGAPNFDVSTDLFNFNGTVFNFEALTFTRAVDDDGLASATDCDAADVASITIQAAVDAANPGDTIKVCPGTYNESQVLIQKAITVVGSGADSTIIDGGAAAVASAGVVRIDLPLAVTGDASFSGFSVTDPGLTGGSRYLIFAKQVSPNSTITISDNKLQGVNLADYGLYTDRPRGPIVVSNNQFLNNAFNPILIERPESSTNVSGNTISGNFSTGYFNFTYEGNNVSGEQRVANNTFNSPNASAISFSAAFQGSTGGYSSISITDNSISALGANRTGITLSNGAIAASQALGTIDNAVISGNRLSGIDGATSNGIRLRGLTNNANVSGNTVSDLARGLWSEVLNTGSSAGLTVQGNRFSSNATGLQSDGAVVSNVTCNSFTANTIGVLISATALGGINVNQNNIVGNTAFGIQNLSTAAANAENNYWGSPDGPGPVGPGSGDRVSTNVDFEPFLTAPSTCGPELPRDCGSSSAPYDLAEDFSLASNPNCEYTYGYTPAADPDSLMLPFQFASADEPVANIDRWHRDQPDPDLVPAVFANRSGATINYLTVVQDPDELNLHPGPLGERAVVRFTVPVTGNYDIVGQFEGIDTGGTTTDVQIVRGVGIPPFAARPEGSIGAGQIFSDEINGYQDTAPFSLTNIQLFAGEVVDFSVGYGSNMNYANDSTGLTAVISLSAAPTPTPTVTPTPTSTPTPTPTPTVTPTPTPTPVRTVRISDVSQGEGNSGTTDFVFDVTISSRPEGDDAVVLGYTTIDQTATIANNDYQATSGTITFTSETDAIQRITVRVNGDTVFEPNEAFIVRLTSQGGDFVLVKREGIGVIFNDDVEGGGTPTPTPTPAGTPTPTPTPAGTPTPTPTPAGTPTPTPNPVIAVEGDVVDANGGPNGDGQVLANDITVIRNFILGLATPVSPSQFQRADVNGNCGDGRIDAADVTVARQFILGTLTPQPACGPTTAATPTPTPTGTPTPSPTATPAGTPTPSPTATPTATPTPSPTATPNGTPTPSPTATPAGTPTPTPTPPSRSFDPEDSIVELVRVIRVVNTQATAGQNVTVSVQLDAQGNEASASFTLNFDPAVLTYVSATAGSGVPAGTNLSLNTSQTAQGRLGVLLDSTNTYAVGTRQLLNVTFNVAGNATSGSYPITFSSTPTVQSVSNAQGVMLPTAFESGNVTLGTTAAGVTISGRITNANGQGVRGATVYMTNSDGVRSSATTSSFGLYRFEDVEAGQTYVIGVTSRRYRFAAKVLNVADSLINVDFVGLE
jgi:hypothetical protein